MNAHPGLRYSSMVEHLPRMLKALSFTPSVMGWIGSAPQKAPVLKFVPNWWIQSLRGD